MIINTHIEKNGHASKPNIKQGQLRNNLRDNLINIHIDDFVYKVCSQGCTFFASIFDGKGTSADNIINYQFVVLDIDNKDVTKKEQATLKGSVKLYTELGVPPFLAYHTFSHSEACEKFRLVWKFEDPINNLLIFEFVVGLLVEYFEINNIKSTLDGPASKKPTMFFYGSNFGYKYYNPNNNINLNVLFECVNNIKKLKTHTTDPIHATRDLKAFYNKLNYVSHTQYINKNAKNININKNVINILSQSDNNVIFTSQINNQIIKFNLKSNVKSNVKINNKSNNNNNNVIINYNKVEEQFLEHFDKIDNSTLNIKILKKLESECCIIKNYINKQYMPHNDRRVLISFLLNFKGGAGRCIKYYKDIKKPIDTNIESFIKKSYLTSGCTKSDTCKRTHNILHLYNDYVKNNIIKDDIKLYDKEIIRDDLKNTLKNIIKSDDNKIYIVECDTGIGKTRAMMEMTHDIEDFVYASLLHDKKEELKPDMPPDSFVQLRLPKLNMRDTKIINNLFATDKSAYLYIKKINKANYTQNQKNDIKIYLRDVDKINSPKNKKIFCTHAKVPFLKNIKNHKLLIYDEDPINTILNIKTINERDLITLKSILNNKLLKTNNSETINNIKTAISIIDYVVGSADLTIKNIDKKMNFDIYELFKDEYKNLKNIETPAFDIFKNKIFIYNKTSHTINTGNPFMLPDIKIIILSATPDVSLYKSLYGDRVEHIKLNKSKIKGQLIQKNDITYSKKCITDNEESMISNIYNEYNNNSYDYIITFKKIKDLLINKGIDGNIIFNFGAIEGLNSMTGSRLLIAGTMNPGLDLIKIIAKIGYNKEVNVTKMKKQLVTKDGITFNFYTYEDDLARKIHLNFTWTHLIQAVGRARVIDNPCLVTILSNFLLYDSKIINNDEEVNAYIRRDFKMYDEVQQQQIIEKCNKYDFDYTTIYNV